MHWGLSGPAGKLMALELRGVDGKRKKARVPYSGGSNAPAGPAVLPQGLERIGRQSYGKLPSGFGDTHLRDVKGELPQQLDTMLGSLGNVPGLILDCRANGGSGTDHDAVFGRFNDGAGIEGIGVPPHEIVLYDAATLAAGKDPLIERAEALLRDFPEGVVPYDPAKHGWKPD